MTRPLTRGVMPFRLWKAQTPGPDREYVGTLQTPQGRTYLVEAYVVEMPDGRKAFEGKVFATDPRRVLQGAKVEGDRSAVPKDVLDLVDLANAMPFDDPLPTFGEVKA